LLEPPAASGRLGLTPLERALRERIRAEGPITVEAYMEACNSYYYATRDPLGAAGDFVTAPEVSQMFGEMIGAALADCWRRAGAPADAVYAELGPGRGTLASDALRVLWAAGLTGAVHFVEASPTLRKAQRDLVPAARWHDSVVALPRRPLLLVANEFFDALPIRQFAEGVERCVGLIGDDLAVDRFGEIVEDSPVRDQAVTDIAAKLVANGGVALIIDYGHAKTAPGDTLQAVHAHRFAPVLTDPGEQDLTAHVDFETLARVATDAGAAVTRLAAQGEWLKRLGIGARAEALIRANPEQEDAIEAALERLTGPDQMGTLFKIIAIHSPDWPEPVGFI
jgi:NADH dehydrogenase [ubiquinone] 1 alpha subcomplex assembly factor 7